MSPASHNEGSTFRYFENELISKVSGPRRRDVKEITRKSHENCIIILKYSNNFVKMITSGNIR
jgi:hypothetical protein